MTATLLNASKDEATFIMEIEAKVFQKTLLEEYEKFNSPDDKKSAPAFLSNEVVLGKHPDLDKIAKNALEKLMPTYYVDAIKELGLKPMSFPKIKPRATALGKPCVIEVIVTLEPELEIKQYEGLEATYTPIVVTEDDLEVQISGLRQQYNAEKDDSKLLENLPFNTIEELKEEILKSFTDMAQEKTNHNKKEAVLKQLVEANPISLKNEIIEQQVMLEINQIGRQMGPQVMQNYLKNSGRDMNDLKKEVRPQAEATVKKNLLLSAIAEKLSPEVNDEDIKEAIINQPGSFMEIATDYETRRKRIDEIPGALDQLIHSIRLEKVADYIIAKAILHERKPINIMEEMPEYMKPEISK